MAEQSSDEERRLWHRRFAVETKNRGWALVEKPELTAADGDELLRSAYAAAHHWRYAGTERNNVLAAVLLAYAHARLGHADLARGYASSAMTFFEGASAAAWELAFAHGAMAAAAAAAHDSASHAAHYARASEIGDGLGTEDKRIFMASFSRVPVPD